VDGTIPAAWRGTVHDYCRHRDDLQLLLNDPLGRAVRSEGQNDSGYSLKMRRPSISPASWRPTEKVIDDIMGESMPAKGWSSALCRLDQSGGQVSNDRYRRELARELAQNAQRWLVKNGSLDKISVSLSS